MEDNNNNIGTLLSLLSGLGVCRTGQRYLKRTPRDFDTLVKVWRGWPEFLCEHSEDACRLLRAYLTAEDRQHLAEKYLFVDHKGVMRLCATAHPVFVIGRSDVRIMLPEFAVVKLYVFNESVVTVEMGDNAILNAEAYDTSMLAVTGGWRGKTLCYQYDASDVKGVERVVPKVYVRGEVFNGKEIRMRR